MQEILRLGVIQRNSRGQVSLVDYSKICAVFLYHTAIKVGHIDERQETDLGFWTWFYLYRAAKKCIKQIKDALGLKDEDIEYC